MKIKKSLVFLITLLTIISLIPPVHADEQQSISVSAVVPPNPSDFQYSFAPTDNKTTVPQNETLSYQITYSALASAGVTTTTTIVADWNDTTAPDGSHLVDYDLGSASNGYGNTTPIVDIERRTITWTIPSLPAGTLDQKVTFSLKTNSNNTKSTHIPFTIRANVSNQYVTLDEKTVSQTYAYQQITPSTQITATPTITPTPAPSISPILVEKKTPRITDIFLREVSQSSATITVSTSKPTALWLKLGTSPRTLADSQATLQPNTTHIITLNDLSPDTTYYIQLLLVTGDGQKTTSEIFSLKTATPSKTLDLDRSVIVFTNNGDILISDVKDKNTNTTPLALLTTNSDYEFTYRLKNQIPLKSIEAIVRNKVLGTNTFSSLQQPTSFNVPMREKEPSVYVATLKTFLPGSFEVFVRIVDTYGNITEQKIADVKVMKHFTVVDTATQKPIADARISLFSYNEHMHLYELLSSELFKRTSNPAYTDLQGEAALILPQGKYRAKVSAFGYDEKIIDFVLGAKAEEDFPQISLRKDLFSFINFVRYYQNAFVDFINHFNKFLSSLSLSLRFFNLIASFVVTSFVFICLLLFTLRTHIRFSHIPAFFFHNIEKLFNKTSPTYISGIVVDEQNQPLTRAHIECIDAQTGKVLAHLDANKIGKFYLFRNKSHAIKLITTRDGYMQHVLLLHPDVESRRDSIQITMQSGIKHTPSGIAMVFEQLENIAGMFFEFVLVFTIIIEFFFFSLFTFASTLPFFALSLFNVILWLFFIREHFEQKFMGNIILWTRGESNP